jgi:hypothetical protein
VALEFGDRQRKELKKQTLEWRTKLGINVTPDLTLEGFLQLVHDRMGALIQGIPANLEQAMLLSIDGA